jgi:hypothetical protein
MPLMAPRHLPPGSKTREATASRAALRRGLVCILVAAAVSLATGCSIHRPFLDPTSATPTSQRNAAVADLLAAARAAGAQFNAGTPLAVRTETWCTQGIDSFNTRTRYRSTCYVSMFTAYAVDIPPLPALSGLELRLAKLAWHQDPSGWTLTGGRGEVVDLKAWNRLGFRLEDLDGVRYRGPREALLVVRPQLSETPAPAPRPPIVTAPGGTYYARSEGSNWQEAWKQQATQHPYVVEVGGMVTYAGQGW